MGYPCACVSILFKYFYKERINFVRTKKSIDPSPLRIVSGTIQPWPKSIEFVREGNEQQEGTLPEDLNREEKVNLIK